MKAAAVQMDIAWEDKHSNLACAKKLILQAAKAGAELVCLPELFATGVSLRPQRHAESLDGPTCDFLSDLASECGIMLLGSFIEVKTGGRPYNSSILFDSSGKLVGVYRKNHLFSFGKETRAYSPGGHTGVAWAGEWGICPLICYDLRFPEQFRLGLDLGANVFVVQANWPAPRKSHWIALLQARAIENQAYVIGVNRVGKTPKDKFSGDSIILSPTGEALGRAGHRQAIVYGELDAKTVRKYRRTFPAIKDRTPKKD